MKDQRREPRVPVSPYHCVEIRSPKNPITYQFKIWNISPNGMCFLVGSGSDFLDYVEVGEVIEIKYYPGDLSWPPDVMRTQIRHITRANPDRFKDHYFVGLLVMD